MPTVMIAMEGLFWITLILLVFAYPGYPLMIGILAHFRSRPLQLKEPVPERVSVVLVAHNEAQRIKARLRNLLACHRPNTFEIIVVCDGCNDATARLARAVDPEIIMIIEQPGVGSKPRGLNTGVATATGEIVVFADARQRFDEDTLSELLLPFSDPQVGAVSGNLLIEQSTEGAGAGIDLYWRLEKFLRKAESSIDSSIGCTGAIYAIRRECFQPIPEDTLLDDVVIPMQVTAQGQRVIFRETACAYDPQSLNPASEKRRKVRTLAGNYQMLFRYPGWLLPWKSRLWLQLAAHKYARLLGPMCIAGILASSFWLRDQHALYQLTFLAGSGTLTLGLLGLLFPRVRWRILTIPAGFLFLQWQCLRSFFYYLRFTRSSGQGW